MVKVGDKVVITARNHGHEMEIGSVHTISNVVDEDYYNIKANGINWAVGDDEIRVISDSLKED